MEPVPDGGRNRRHQRAVRTRIGAAVAAGIGFGAAVAGFAVHDHSTTATTVTSGDTATTPTTTPSVDQFGDDQFGGDQFGATPGFGSSSAPDSTSRGS
jgi:hypothetical protein